MCRGGRKDYRLLQDEAGLIAHRFITMNLAHVEEN